LVITTDEYVANKLGPNAVSFNHRFKMCTFTASKYPWCHCAHIPLIYAGKFAKILKDKKNFDRLFGSNPLVDESEIASLYTINCKGADNVSKRSPLREVRERPQLKVPQGYVRRFKRDSTSIDCVIARDGYNEGLKKAYAANKAKGGRGSQRLIFVDLEVKPVSSTLIRQHLLKLRREMCGGIKGGKWTLNDNVPSKEMEIKKDTFRKGVKGMLHPEVMEYLIQHIADLWIVENSKEKLVGLSAKQAISAMEKIRNEKSEIDDIVESEKDKKQRRDLGHRLSDKAKNGNDDALSLENGVQLSDIAEFKAMDNGNDTIAASKGTDTNIGAVPEMAEENEIDDDQTD